MVEFLRQHAASLLQHYGNRPLLWNMDGTAQACCAEGYIPLLTTYTKEDKEAKGLRRIETPQSPRPPVHFSTLEVVQQTPFSLLLGEKGSGKTSFALDLALNLAGGLLHHSKYNLENLTRSIPRNDQNFIEPESWTLPLTWPVYAPVYPQDHWHLFYDRIEQILKQGNCFLIIDGLENFSNPDEALKQLESLHLAHINLRLVILANDFLCQGLCTPATLTKFSIMGLNAAQQRALSVNAPIRTGQAALPNLVTAANATNGQQNKAPLTSLAITAAWVNNIVPLSLNKTLQTAVTWYWQGNNGAFDHFPQHIQPFLASSFAQTTFFPSIAAHALLEMTDEARLSTLESDLSLWRLAIAPLVALLQKRQQTIEPLIRGLLNIADPAAIALRYAANLVIQHIRHDLSLQKTCRSALLDFLQHSTAPIPTKNEVAQLLAELGDPRRFDDLITIPAGNATLGSGTHVNSTPVHTVPVKTFKIGRFPVTNLQYACFVQQAARPWPSLNALQPAHANIPATNVTWYDAQAYCNWLTKLWRKQGRISSTEVIRLPTEPEWEWAARGTQPDHPGKVCYPWGQQWHPGLCNSSELGLNVPISVGLSAAGHSPFGVEDMVGQVWEWTSTLWGQDMTHPDYAYPYCNDGRENQNAPANVRRVLRGGCFSSPSIKANCSYRGSLEPNGFWRGNGFRIVVAQY
ncbi:formylglycine-generating enzyme family protein [Acetobacter syzygii]|uniref:formylglycine-generating enzyme family protein n=1 Tax=Acetobacter syzygii TaxID=146476 RepID=UPI00242B5CEB|nr:formylglycine-generating enzyme family protein [Acetobacter syzygii]